MSMEVIKIDILLQTHELILSKQIDFHIENRLMILITSENRERKLRISISTTDPIINNYHEY